MRIDADGLTALNATISSLTAGGGVLPRVLVLRPPLTDGDRDVDARDGTFAVAVLEPDDNNPVLSMPDTTDGKQTALPNPSSEIASNGASSMLPSSSTVGRATTRSRLSESPNFAVEPEDAPESVRAPATTRGSLRLITCCWTDTDRHQPTFFSLLFAMNRKKLLRSSPQAVVILASLTSVSWLSKPGPWSGEGIPNCLFALEPNITQDMKSNDKMTDDDA